MSVAQVVELAASGLQPRAIAAATGLKVSTVQVYLSNARRNGLPPRKVNLKVPMPRRLLERFRDAAVARGVEPAELAEQLLTLIVRDDLFDAVIDE